MKCEALCLSKQHDLFLLDGTPLNARSAQHIALLQNDFSALSQYVAQSCAGTDDKRAHLMCLSVAWSAVGLTPETYNEAFLASLRDWLKTLEGKPLYVFIEPHIDLPVEGAEAKENCIASFVHCARRIKDCTAVVGFALLPFVKSAEESRAFTALFAKKHAHYVFFCKDSALLETEPGLVAY